MLCLQDTLGETVTLSTAALGAEHAVVNMAAELARANLSSSKRAALLEQKRLRQVRGSRLPSYCTFAPVTQTQLHTLAHYPICTDAYEV